MDLANELRQLADKIEQAQSAVVVCNDMSVTEAVRLLRADFKAGKLTLCVEWSGYEDDLEAEWAVFNGSSYKALAKGTLASAVREAIEAHKPHDVLERLEAAIPVGEKA